MFKATIFLGLYIAFLQAQHADTLWSEDWEGDWTKDWHVDAGTWEVGTPTSGPDSAYEGKNCAATVLAGNYADGVNTRLIRHTVFSVPAEESNPYLRFYHWLAFNIDDYFRVQIKEENGVWENITPTYTNNRGSDVWSPSIVYLNKYAGKNVQIAFFFHSYNHVGSPDVNSGSYIDNISLIYNAQFKNPENFDLNVGDWGADGGNWQHGTPGAGPSSAHSQPFCIGTNLNGNYSEPASSRFISPPFIVPEENKNPALRFWHWFNFSTDDYGQVQIKEINEDNWTDLENGHYTSTSSNTWTNTYFSLAAYSGKKIQIGFYFSSYNHVGSPDVSSGWYIDDIQIDGLEEESNQVPYVQDSISDTSFKEDSGLHLITEDLNTVFSDPDGDELTFAASSDNTDILPSIHGDSLFVTSSENYFGSGNVFVTATDPGGLSATDTFMVTITPVNDAPGAFNLLAPADKDTVDTLSMPIQFVWSQAENVDQDTIWYDLKIFNASIDTSITDLTDTTFTFHGESILKYNDSYQWTVTARDHYEYTPADTFLFYTPEATSIHYYGRALPKRFALEQNYPNPFNPTTTIKYALPKSGKVKVEVFNLLGQKVAALVNSFKQAGYHQITFDGSNLASGVYVYRLSTDAGFMQTRKMILMR